MELSTLTAISPIDGRYRSKTSGLDMYFSEFALIRYRVKVEVEYFIALCKLPLPQLADVPAEALAALLERCEALFSQALVLLYGGEVQDRELAGQLGKRLTKTQIVRTIELMKKYRRECGYNVGPGHVLGALAAELEEIF